MAKKKTSVLLPGGIQGLVHDLQNGKSNFAPKVIETTVDDAESRRKHDKNGNRRQKRENI